MTSFVSCNATHLEQRKPLATLKYSVMLVLHLHFRYSTLFIMKENIQGYFSSRHLYFLIFRARDTQRKLCKCLVFSLNLGQEII